MPVTVVLRHEYPDGSFHFDWMLQPTEAAHAPLITFNVAERVDVPACRGFTAQRAGDHRAVYLTYEGPISGNRGLVRRLATGICNIIEHDEFALVVEVDFGHGPRVYRGQCEPGTPWTFEVKPLEPAGTAADAEEGSIRLSGGGGASPGSVPATHAEAPMQAPSSHMSSPMLAVQRADAFDDSDKPIPVIGETQAAPPVARAPGPAPSGGASGDPAAAQAASKIKAFEQRLSGGRHEEKWQRSPNVTGTGAIHCKSFHCKLTDESLHYLDQQINEWLDAHPQYEVKFVTTSIGDWTGKIREPNLIVQVWV